MHLSKPTNADVERLLDAQRYLAFSYPGPGCTAGEPPPGFTIDRTRVRLGTGEATFQRARDAIRLWKQFDFGWVSALPARTPIVVGSVICVAARVLGLWWLNPCRIVSVIDEPRRFGFSYGTLPAHVESGEERFLVEWDPAEGSEGTVWYDILAYSRPRHLLVRLAYPLTRQTQRRFARDSSQAMLRAMANGGSP